MTPYKFIDELDTNNINDLSNEQIMDIFKFDTKLISIKVTYLNGKYFYLYAIAPKRLEKKSIIDCLYWYDWGDEPYINIGPNYAEIGIKDYKIEELNKNNFKDDMSIIPFYLGILSFFNHIDMTINEYFQIK